MYEQKEEVKKSEMMMFWDKLGDGEKKVLVMRELEGKIMKKEHIIKQQQYEVETLNAIKSWCLENLVLEKEGFEVFYQTDLAPWDIGRPRKEIVQLEQAGKSSDRYSMPDAAQERMPCI
ncbi:MAG TPA: hypothetical protein VEG44_08655 [Candidatus Acidoferrales bacterium]|nr:hypothetical protein [Candidatus Acidoferrales bacterium]